MLVAAGLWSSLHRALWAWTADGDIATPWLVWSQLRRIGPSALTQWRYAVDNWLFSLLLPDLGLFALAGARPILLVVEGWAIFVAVAAMLFVLLRPAVGARAALVAASLLLLGPPALAGGVGYLSYPVSHGVSILWMLLALAGFLAEGGLAVGLATVALFVGAMSDPWLAATGSLPLLLALLGLAAIRPERRAGLGLRAALVLAVMLLVRSRLFGLLWFLPAAGYVFGTPRVILGHLRWDAIYVSTLFNAVPQHQTGSEWTPPAWSMALDCAAVGLGLAWALWRLWRHRAALPHRAQLLAAYAALASAAILAAFTLSNTAAELVEGRYLCILAVTLPILLVLALAATGPCRLAQGVAALWCIGFVASGVLASPSQLARLPATVVRPQTTQLLAFLEANGLRYGYGPFWGTLAPVLAWVSHGQVTMRAVVSYWPVRRIEPRLAQSYPSWYEPGDAPPGQSRFFFVAVPDGETCPDVESCRALATHEFGPPASTLMDGATPVMVWNHPLLQDPDRAVLDATAPLVPGQKVFFGAGQTGPDLLWQGWGRPEQNASWTQARRAVLLLHLPQGWQGAATLLLRGNAYRGRRPTQRFVFRINGRQIGVGVLGGSPQDVRLAIPASLIGNGRLAVVIDCPDAVSPSTLGRSFDPRELGLFLNTLVLLPPMTGTGTDTGTGTGTGTVSGPG